MMGPDLYTFLSSLIMPMTIHRYEGLIVTQDKARFCSKVALAAMDHPRSDFAIATDGETIFVTGGYVVNEVSKTALMFNPTFVTSQKLPDMNLPRMTHSSTVAGSRLYVIGDRNDCNEIDGRGCIEVLDLGADHGEPWE